MTVASEAQAETRLAEPAAGSGSRMDALIRAGARLSYFAGVLGALMGFALIVVVMLGIVGRSLRTTAFGWSFEVSGYLLVGIVFFGSAYAALTDGLIRVQILTSRLSKRATNGIRLIGSIASLAFAALLLWEFWKYFSYTLEHKLHSETLLGTPQWMPQSLMIAGTGLLVLELARQLLQRVREMLQDRRRETGR
jgi:C4-dicarboxylate transporter, DctQ subunit